MDKVKKLLDDLSRDNMNIDRVGGDYKRIRVSEWTMPNGETGRSVQKIFEPEPETTEYPVDELVQCIANSRVDDTPNTSQSHAMVLAAGDFQIGKGLPGGETRNMVRNYLSSLNLAKDYWNRTGKPSRVHIAFLGDMIEGFVSQRGNNAWRTQLALTEQIRLTRMAMLRIVQTFDHCPHVTVTSIPGNHGEAVRFGKGVTTYDDSFDVDCLRAVAEAYHISGRSKTPSFIFPHKDEMTTTARVEKATILHAHGHQWKTGKHFEWWQGQEFHNGSKSSILLAGHRHNFMAQEQGRRTFIQCPSLEDESTWFRHKTGVTGNPGMVCFTVRDGIPQNIVVAR